MRTKAAIIIAAITIAGCSAGDGGSRSPVLATVNGSSITQSQFNERMALLNLGFENVSGGSAPDTDAKMDVLSQLIEEEMYLQEARRLNISAPKAAVEFQLKKLAEEYPPGVFEKALKRAGITIGRFRQELHRKLTVDMLLEREVYSKLGIDKARALSYFEANRREFHRPERVRASQIVVDNEEDAKAILRELKGGASFEELARARSFTPDSAAGGDLGYFSRGEMPQEFESVVFRMKPGETSGVVKTPYGYHIFRVVDVKKAEDPPFEEVEREVKDRLVALTGEDAFRSWQDGLKEKALIEVDTDLIGRL